MERYDAFQALWSLYITVAVGVLAYVAATTTTSSSPLVRLLLVAGFLAFASVNFSALSDVRDQRHALCSIARSQLPDKDSEGWKLVLERAAPPEQRDLRNFHFAVDLVVVAIVWMMPTLIFSLRPIFDFDDNAVRPTASELPEAIVSWDQRNKEWRLSKSYSVAVQGRTFRIPEGFCFDLATIPRVFWWVIAPFELSVVAPLVHDFAYRFGGRMPESTVVDANDRTVTAVTREEADLAFLELMRREGVSRTRRTQAYYAVHFLGDGYWLRASRAYHQASGEVS